MSQFNRRAGSRAGWSRTALAAGAALLAIAAVGCTDDSGTTTNDNTEDTVAADTTADLLGPDDVASGEPVKIGLVSDGVTDAFDNTDELRAGEATAEYFNQHKGGVAGRPIEIVTCEIGGDPARAADCANKFITEDVLAVTLSQSTATVQLWEILNEAGIPTFFTQANDPAMEADDTTSFLVFNPRATFFGLPIAVAESEGTSRIDFVIIDVPQAVEIIEQSSDLLTDAGIEYEVIRVPIGTADMTAQMQQVANNGAGVVQVIGNDSFCIAAFQGLAAVDYQGEITAITQCFTDATREAMPTGLEGINVASTIALGDTSDPTYQLFQAIMTQYGQAVTDVDNATSLGGYAAVASLATALQDLTGEVTTETVAAAIKAMPESEYPAGAGMTYQCGGSAVPTAPAICTNQWLRTQLDAGGNPTTYTVEDSSGVLD